MGLTETYVYICLRTPPPDPKPRWFILRRRETLDASVLMPIPSLPSQPPEASSVVVLGWFIYVIGGSFKEKTRTSDVWLLDCRTHTWSHVPYSMGVARANAAARVVDGKIYVIGGCDVFNPNTWGEVFDPKTQTWSFLPPLPLPLMKGGNKNIHDSVVMDQKIYVVDGNHRTYFYSPSKGYWGRGNRGQVSRSRRDWCMIELINRIYFLTNDGTIFFCEQDELYWPGREGIMMDTKEVKGLGSLNETLFRSRVVHFGQLLLDRWERVMYNFGGTIHELEDIYPGARLINFGGNIGLFWDVIKGDHLEIWGNIEWSNAVMTVDNFLDRYKSNIRQDC
ncbi:PREDICTED: putative F-box/kelch-repeat protein At3g24610 [Camelina sativa]|uniref:F-box/kelch-repeat protein At3g24610 n=1 Tax=Camelina sativa TaxID=90675 RepID=A0ABM0URB1_CAMSA|nr:PREDICTED: putative F-box/kelch-repeat protein At3g24610 [Camelina sativa]